MPTNFSSKLYDNLVCTQHADITGHKLNLSTKCSRHLLKNKRAKKRNSRLKSLPSSWLPVNVFFWKMFIQYQPFENSKGKTMSKKSGLITVSTTLKQPGPLGCEKCPNCNQCKELRCDLQHGGDTHTAVPGTVYPWCPFSTPKPLHILNQAIFPQKRFSRCKGLNSCGDASLQTTSTIPS